MKLNERFILEASNPYSFKYVMTVLEEKLVRVDLGIL